MRDAGQPLHEDPTSPTGSPARDLVDRSTFEAVIARCWDAISLHNQAGTIVAGNAALGRLLRCRTADLVGVDPFSFIDPGDAIHVRELFATIESTRVGRVASYHILDCDGERRRVETAVANLLDVDGVQGIVLSTRDITEVFQTNERLEWIATHDSTTGALNRAGLVELLGPLLAERRSPKVVVAAVDLHHFELLRNRVGPAAGDDVLRDAFTRLSGLPGALVARSEGDGFIVAAFVADPSSAEEFGRTLIATLAAPARVRNRDVRLAARVGVAYAASSATAQKLVRDAQAALYDAKESGRLVVRCTPAIHARVRKRANLEAAVRTALDNEDFRLAYQPINCLELGSQHGFEALLRWSLHGREQSPEQFIPVAEDAGLIIPLGRWVIEQACAAAARLNADHRARATISVNLSPNQLNDPELVSFVGAAIDRYQAPASSVAFEITENAAMYDVHAAVGTLTELQRLGCRIGIDDFGTGHSSLGYLSTLPVDYIKIDRTFVAQLNTRAGRAVVDAVVAIAASLGAVTIAEGIETQRQEAELARLGCHLGQGYYLGRPAELPATIASHHCRISAEPALADPSHDTMTDPEAWVDSGARRPTGEITNRW